METERTPRTNEVEALKGPDFSWWYLDFLGDNGKRINAVVYQRDIFGPEKKPRLSLTIVGEDNPQHFSRSLEDVDFPKVEGPLNLPGLIEERDDKIQFCFKLSDGVSFQGEIDRRCEPFALNEGVLHQDENTGNTNNWVVVLPHGRFQATLTVDGKEEELHGSAYIDRQFGTERVQDFAEAWVWGHFARPEESLVFYQILTRDKQQISGLIRASETGVSFIEDVWISHLSVLTEMENPENADLEVRITQKDGMEVMSFVVSKQRVMHVKKEEKTPFFTATYVRWAPEGLVDGKEMSGITEFMRMRSVEEDNLPPTIIFFAGLSGAGKTTLTEILAQKLGLIPIKVKEIYEQLGRQSIFRDLGDWFRAVGPQEFLKAVEEAILEKIKSESSSRGFIIDAAANTDIINYTQQAIPEANIVVINVLADEPTREERIVKRQNLPPSQAGAQREFFDGFLIDSGMKSVIEVADITVTNEGKTEVKEIIDDIIDRLNLLISESS